MILIIWREYGALRGAALRLPISAAISPFMLFGCASALKVMAPSYGSLGEDQYYDCRQISTELQCGSRRPSELIGHLEEEWAKDQAHTVIRLLLFCPPLLFLEGGAGLKAAPWPRLKGEVIAF